MLIKVIGSRWVIQEDRSLEVTAVLPPNSFDCHCTSLVCDLTVQRFRKSIHTLLKMHLSVGIPVRPHRVWVRPSWPEKCPMTLRIKGDTPTSSPKPRKDSFSLNSCKSIVFFIRNILKILSTQDKVLDVFHCCNSDERSNKGVSLQSCVFLLFPHSFFSVLFWIN